MTIVRRLRAFTTLGLSGKHMHVDGGGRPEPSAGGLVGKCLEDVNSVLALSDVKTVFELGARDCAETAEFSSYLPQAEIYSFECNPVTLPMCRQAVASLPNVTLVEKAAADHDGAMTFYAIDQVKTETSWADGNPGASSLLRASGNYPLETYVQTEITVQGTRLSSYMKEAGLESIDLLWMDIQGAELMALRGLGTKIRDVKVVITEVEFIEIYENQPLFEDIRAFLSAHGFRLYAFGSWGRFSGDTIFVNEAMVHTWQARAALIARDLLLPLRHRVKQFVEKRSRAREFRGVLRRLRSILTTPGRRRDHEDERGIAGPPTSG
jgi:FkbM family methyltransferase